MKRLLPLAVALAAAGAAAGCAPTAGPPRTLAPQLLPDTNHPDDRVSGPIGYPAAMPQPLLSYGAPATVSLPPAQGAGAGDVSLDFADTDIREVVAQILGSILKVNYTIDPAVHGTATLHTVTPLARSQLLPTLEALLSETGATLVETDGLYRVLPASGAGGAGGGAGGPGGGGLAGGGDTSGDQLVPLHYVSATDLAKVLQPFVGQSARIAVDPGSNSLVIAGDPDARDALVSLAQAFDTNLLAGQSYALLPSPQGGAADFATELQTAFRSQGDGLTNVVRVVPMERAGAVLLIAAQPAYIDAARRVYDLLERKQRETVRNWNVYYLKDTKAEDAAYLLQEAFTPDNVTATPSASTTNQQGSGATTGGTSSSGIGTGTSAGTASGGSPGIGSGTSINGTSGGILGGGSSGAGAGGGASTGASAAPSQTAANPLLGGLGASGGSGGTTDTDALRIIPDEQNNSVMIYATQDEEDRIDAMLRKIDIVPLQVRIDATIAEVTLNSQLQYGTQFFFRSGGINGILNNTSVSTPLGSTPASTVLSTAFPGFVLSGNGAGGAPIALQALQAVTTVKVLSSPELMVLDGQTARLQVGQLVPYLTSSSQSTVANSAVINSIDYQPTGVIMNVTPRVSEGGLVTLDISQQVSAVDTSVSTTTTGISSPTFSEQDVSSRVTVKDGQTVGLAGLITDNLTKSNSGIPFLKDIPLIGLLAGTQNNTRTRDELLILITPHVQYDENDARALTSDLQSQLQDAATVPGELNGLQSPGSDDPNAVVRHQLHLDQ
jgi:general secretion pathway protein D